MTPTSEQALSKETVLYAATNDAAEYIEGIFEYKPGRVAVCSWPGAAPFTTSEEYQAWRAAQKVLPRWIDEAAEFEKFKEACEMIGVFFTHLRKIGVLDEFMDLYNATRRKLNKSSLTNSEYVKKSSSLIF